MAKRSIGAEGITITPKDRSVPEGGIKVGMGATFGVGSDCYPYTVVEVVSPTTVIVTADNYKRIDKNGFSESQEYEYTPDPNGCRITVTRRLQRGDYVWRKKGDHAGGGRFSFHGRRAYQDPSF